MDSSQIRNSISQKLSAIRDEQVLNLLYSEAQNAYESEEDRGRSVQAKCVSLMTIIGVAIPITFGICQFLPKLIEDFKGFYLGRYVVCPQSIAIFYLIFYTLTLALLLRAFLQAVRTIELKKHSIVDIKTLIDPDKNNTEIMRDIICDLIVARHVIFESNQQRCESYEKASQKLILFVILFSLLVFLTLLFVTLAKFFPLPHS